MAVTQAKHEEEELLRAPRSSMDELRVTITEYRQHPVIHVRGWYREPGGQEWKPGKGIALREHELPDVIAALTAAAQKLGMDMADGEAET